MEWNTVLSEALKACIIACVPIIVSIIGYLATLLKVWIEAHTRNQWLLVIEREAFQVVAAVGQSVVAPLKEAAKDGSLTPEEIQKVKGIAITTLTERLKDIPVHLFPDLGKRIGDAIEAAVPQAKAENPTASPVQK